MDQDTPDRVSEAAEQPSAPDPEEQQRAQARARQAAALERMRAQQAEFAQREPGLPSSELLFALSSR